MNTITIILMIVCSIVLGLCFLALVEDARATKFLEDHGNQRKVRECFGQEGLQLQFNFSNHTCSVGFMYQGALCDRTITFAKAVALYNSRPDGCGMRKLFIEKEK